MDKSYYREYTFYRTTELRLKRQEVKFSSLIIKREWNIKGSYIQGDQKLSVHRMITIQKVTSNVQSVPFS
jgi:hypothetical protein